MVLEQAALHPSEVQTQRHNKALWIYKACLGYAILSTLLWIFLITTRIDGGLFFGDYLPPLEKIIGFTVFFIIFWMTWSYGFHWIKYWLLKRSGFSQEELRQVFGNRLEGFHLESLLQRHSERRIRIIDMIARRGRTIVFMFIGVAYVYFQTKQNPTPEAFMFGLQSSLFDALVMLWWSVLTFRSNGVLGHMAYGAQARIMDGVQGRANALCIMTLWGCFKFVMIPLGLRLAEVYPPETYAVLYLFIWVSYSSTDFASEIFGSIFGKQGIKVWGLGDVNRKSWAGIVAGFLFALTINVVVVWGHNLSSVWLALGVLLAFINPLVELYSPRGTDDFTMATTNAVICLGYGLMFPM